MKRGRFLASFLVIVLMVILLLFIFYVLPMRGVTTYIISEEREEGLDSYSRVTRVIDGDTIEIDTGERVRLNCIDAPEEGIEYKKAKDFLAELILDEEVMLVKDKLDTDRYGRLLRGVYTIDGRFVNSMVVGGGYGKADLKYPDMNLCAPVMDAESSAKKMKAGIWSEKGWEDEDFYSDFICDYNAYDCSDFYSQAQAQRVFQACAEKTSRDVHRLDGDKDGMACDSLPWTDVTFDNGDEESIHLLPFTRL